MITNGSKIQLVSPMGVFTNVGEVCEVIDINTYGGVVSISFKFGNGRHLGVMSFDEYQKYFKEYEEVETKPKEHDLIGKMIFFHILIY